MWGSKYVWDSIVEDLQALSRHLLLNDSSKLDSHRLSSIRKTTLQVDVDVDCTETFFVSDDRTEEVRVCFGCFVHVAGPGRVRWAVPSRTSSRSPGEPWCGGRFVQGAPNKRVAEVCAFFSVNSHPHTWFESTVPTFPHHLDVLCEHPGAYIRCPDLYRNPATQVVQGSKAVGVSKHRLRLECSPFFKRDFQWVVSVNAGI